jgi:alpha-glucosidase (family GH31 glycosyl hydrolase)
MTTCPTHVPPAHSKIEVDLEIIPAVVRAGSIVPLGPVKQYGADRVSEPLSISIYPGPHDSFLLYEDSSTSFNHRRGDWRGLQMLWNEPYERVSSSSASGSKA